MDDVMQRLVARVVPDRTERPAADLDGMLHAWDVAVLDEWAAAAGQLDWADGGPRIRLSPTSSTGRRRSTLAHELGHLVLDPVFGRPASRQRAAALASGHREAIQRLIAPDLAQLQQLKRQIGIEGLCDRFAWELLMPVYWARPIAASVDDLHGLLRAARLFEVSLSFLVTRLNEFDADLMLLRLLPSRRGEWVITDSTCATRSWTEGEVLDRASVARLTAARRTVRPQPLQLRTSSSDDTFTCELLFGSRYVSALGARRNTASTVQAFDPVADLDGRIY